VDDGATETRWVAIESPRVGPSGRSENGGLNPATLQLLRIVVVVVVSRTSRRWQCQTHRAVRSPFFDWHAALARETHNKGDAGVKRGNGEMEEGIEGNRAKRERIGPSPAKAASKIRSKGSKKRSKESHQG